MSDNRQIITRYNHAMECGSAQQQRDAVYELLQGEGEDFVELRRLFYSVQAFHAARRARRAVAAAPEAPPAAEGNNTSTDAIVPPPQPVSGPLDCLDGYCPMMMEVPCRSSDYALPR